MGTVADQAESVPQQRFEGQPTIPQHRAAHPQFDLTRQHHAFHAFGVVIEQP
ncbi:hypothetical protein D3C77_732220 [compost metagenome]